MADKESLALKMEVVILDEKVLGEMIALCNKEGQRPAKEPETALFLDALQEMLEKAMDAMRVRDVPAPQTLAALDVAAERRRQIKKGYTVANDLNYDDHSMIAEAAATYCLSAGGNATRGQLEHIWPWNKMDLVPKDARRDLVRGAALALAAIEYIDEKARLAAVAAKGH